MNNSTNQVGVSRPLHHAGFMLAPLLYMLALGGIGAAVMFSGYSQVLRSNAEMTSVNAVRQQLNSAAQTLSASSTLTSSNTILTVPSVQSFASVTDTARLPTGYGGVTTAVVPAPTAAGVVDPSVGIRQLDPWGKYYVYCKWDSAIAVGTNPSISMISAGPDGVLQSNCGHSAAQGDDRINKLSVAEAISRANVWQVASGTGTASFGASSAVQVTASGALTATTLTTTGAIIGGTTIAATSNITSGGTVSGGNITSTGAVTATGTVTGGNLATGGTVTATGTVTGGNLATGGAVNATGTVTGGAIATGGTVTATGTVTGGNLATGGNVTASGAVTATGTVTGGNLVTSGNVTATGTITSNNEIISTMGSGFGQFRAVTGSYGAFIRNDGPNTYFLLTASGSQYGTWNALRPFTIDNANGNVSMANSQVTISHATGAISTTGAMSAGSLTLTAPLAVAQGGTGATTAAAARTNLGLGTMATQNANAVAITGGTISGVTISGGAFSGTVPFASINSFPGGANYLRSDGVFTSVAPSSIAGFPSNATTFLRGDGTWAAAGGGGSAAGGTGAVQFANGTAFAADATNFFWDNTNKRLGIGTITPSYKLDVAGDARVQGTVINNDAIEVGATRTGNRWSYIDFHGDDTYPDFSLRLLRDNVGPNGSNYLQTRGTGALNIYTTEAAPIVFATSSAERMRISAGGYVGIGSNNPAYPLEVYGNVAGNYVASFSNAGSHGLVGTATLNGIVGYASTAGGSGVFGQNSVTNASGILGAGTNGVSGVTASTSGSGVVGQGAASGSSSFGVFGSAGSYNAGLARADGYSFVGVGQIYNTGALQVTGTATAASFSGSGASLTALNANNISSGTVATARLGTGTADSTTYLRGDGTWATPSGGGGGAGCAGGRVHMQIWTTNDYPGPVCGSGPAAVLYQCQNGAIVTISSISPVPCNGN